MSQLCKGTPLRTALLLVLLAMPIAGCQKGPIPPRGAAAPRPTVSGAARNRQVLDYFLDNKKLEWSELDATVDLMAPDYPTKGDIAAFMKIRQEQPLPRAMRTLIEKALPVEADAYAGKSSLSLKEAQQAIGAADSFESGSVSSGLAPRGGFFEGTWYSYGAVDVFADHTDMVRGLRVDLAHFKG